MTSRNNLYIFSKQDKKSVDQKENVAAALRLEGFNVLEHPGGANCIISLGTDGTFLQAVRKTGFRKDTLYAGILTTGKHAMYCDFHYDRLEDVIQSIRKSEIEVRRYPVLEVTIDGHAPFLCLNEFSLRSNIIRMFAMDIRIDGHLFETFLGDGVIISTPTGSAAYNKSVGGAVVDPLLPCFQVTELASVNNNSFRTLGSPFILSGQRKLELNVHQDGNDFPSIAVDNEALGIRRVEHIEIKLSAQVVKTVKLRDNSFWEKVQRIYL